MMAHEVDHEAVEEDRDPALDQPSDQDRAHQNDHATLAVEAVAAIAQAHAIDLDHAVDDPDHR